MRLRERYRSLAALAVAEEEVSKSITTRNRCARASGGVGLEKERPPRELVSDLVILVVPDLESEAQRVLAARPG